MQRRSCNTVGVRSAGRSHLGGLRGVKTAAEPGGDPPAAAGTPGLRSLRVRHNQAPAELTKPRAMPTNGSTAMRAKASLGHTQDCAERDRRDRDPHHERRAQLPGPTFPTSTRPTDVRTASDAQSVSDQLRLSTRTRTRFRPSKAHRAVFGAQEINHANAANHSFSRHFHPMEPAGIEPATSCLQSSAEGVIAVFRRCHSPETRDFAPARCRRGAPSSAVACSLLVPSDRRWALCPAADVRRSVCAVCPLCGYLCDGGAPVEA